MEPRDIDQPTRRAIADYFSSSAVSWAGRFEEDQFLGRLFDLSALPSKDYRFATAAQDIHQHQVRNSDWSPDWVFYDDRFGLLTKADEDYLAFLCQTVDPNVQQPLIQAQIVDALNSILAMCGWRLDPTVSSSGMTTYQGVRIDRAAAVTHQAALAVAEKIDDDYFDRMITRLLSTADTAPEECIGTAKELIETICRVVLDERSIALDKGDDLPKLVKAALNALGLDPAQQQTSPEGRAMRQLGSALTSVTQAVTELRNLAGTGHGRLPGSVAVGSVQAHLVAGAATSVSRFLYETHQQSARDSARI